MTHSDWELQCERLSASLDGELTDAEQAALEAHLPTCEQCQRELAALRQTRALLHALPTPELPRAFTLPALPSIAERRQRAPTWTRPVQAIGGVAAMIGLGLLVATSLPHITQPSAAGAGTTASAAHTENGALPASPVAGSSTYGGASGTVTRGADTNSTPSEYGPIHAPSYAPYAPEVASQPFPIAPVTGTTLLVGGAAAVAAGSLARRRRRRDDPFAAWREQASG